MTGMKMVLTYEGRSVESMEREELVKLVLSLWLEKEQLQAEVKHYKSTQFDHFKRYATAGSPSLSTGREG